MKPLAIAPMGIWKLPDNKQNMLAEIISSGDYFCQEKIDGYFYQFEKTDRNSFLFSRNISTSTGTYTEKSGNVPHIIEALECLPARTIIIGEIYYPNKTSKDVTTIMGCLPNKAIKRQSEEGLIHYYVHDIIYYDDVSLLNTKAIDRYKILKAIWQKHNLDRYDFLKLADCIESNIQEYVNNILDNNGEGAVLKHKNSYYSPDKKPAWVTIKIKKFDLLDAICIGLCDATKEYTGEEIENWQYWYDEEEEELLTGLLYNKFKEKSNKYTPVTKGYYNNWKTSIEIGAYNENNEIVKIGTVSSGLTDFLCEDLSKNPDKYLNKVVKIYCMEKNKKDCTLRHPLFKGFRDDKMAKECKIDEIFS